jgi:uncharacterized membrane protein YhaH (DUF805 family)
MLMRAPERRSCTTRWAEFVDKSGGDVSWYLEVVRKYATFSGRARRKEFWFFYLFNLIFAFVLAFLDGALGLGRRGYGPFYTIYMLAVLLPYIGVSIRRMHDTNHRGWWILVPFVNLVLAVSNGTEGPNRFGPDPKVPVGQYPMTSAVGRWLPDPTGRHQFRYWDSARWTSSVADNGVASLDDL